jgi:HSP20 family protein
MVNLRLRRPETPARRRALDWESMWDLDRDFFGPLALWMRRPVESMSESTWAPRVDIVEKKDSWIFKAEIPEMDPKDINVSISEGILSIKGERKFEEEIEEGNYTRFERHYGTFERSFSLPSGVDSENVKADYKNGVLTLRIPKKEEARPKSIKIETG